MNRILLILTFYLLADAVFSEMSCLTWEMTSEKLDIICRLEEVVLPVSIYDTFGKEQGKCVFKDYSALCSSSNRLANITANYSNGEFKLSLTNVTKSLVKGEWSCIQGTQTFKTAVIPSAGIISSTDVLMTGKISHHSSMKTVNLSCFSCREPHGNNVEFLMNHHSEDNVRYDHVTKRCLHKDGECSPGQCSCSNSGNSFTYTFDITYISAETSFSCGMRFVDKLILTRFLKFSSVIYDGKELKSNGSETVITKASVIIPENETESRPNTPIKEDANITKSRPNTPIKEDANITKTGLKWGFIAVAVFLPFLLISVIGYCIKRNRKEWFRKWVREIVELDHLLLTDIKEQKEHTDIVGKQVLLIAIIAKKVIKRIVTFTLLTDGQTFKSYLSNEKIKHALFHAWHNKKICCQCKSDDKSQKESLLTKQQFQIMFNNSGLVPKSHVHKMNSKMCCLYNIVVNENVSLDVIDVSVAYCLLVCGCTPEKGYDLPNTKSILDSMEIIKDKRNEIFHMTALKHISDDEFNDNWQKIQRPLVHLASVINSSFCNEILGEINDLQNENLQDTTAYSEKMAELLMQSQQDVDLKINQLSEERFRSKLSKGNKVTNSIKNKEKNILTKMDQLSLNIIDYPDVKVEDYPACPDQTTLDLLLRVQAPNDWNEDEIMEIIRLKVNQINSTGNTKIKETTLENFMLIIEIRIATLIKEELLKNEIEDFFRRICLQCKIDTTQPNTIEVSIENLSHTSEYIMISGAENNSEFSDQTAAPSSLILAIDRDSTNSKCTDPSLEKKLSDVDLTLIRNFVIQKGGKDAFVTSCAVWSDDHYILIDSNNRFLLMYNHKTGDVQSEDLRNEPFSMAIINNNVAISFPERQEIHIYSVGTRNPFKCKEVIKVGGKCFRLTKKDDETLFVYTDSKGILSFNMSNKEFKSLEIPSFVPHPDEH